MKITILTCTGDRHGCLSMARRNLERLLSTWDAASFEWVVVDDGAEPCDAILAGTSLPLRIVRRQRTASDSAHTLPANLLAADVAVRENGGPVVMAEDDDYYRLDWFDEAVAALDDMDLDLYGEGDALYYNVPFGGFFHNRNNRHASLAATAVGIRAWERLMKKCANEPNDPCVDLWLWRNPRNADLRQQLRAPVSRGDHKVLQMKAMPGRPSTLRSHTNLFRYMPDRNLEVLHELVLPEDLPFYVGIVAEERTVPHGVKPLS